MSTHTGGPPNPLSHCHLITPGDHYSPRTGSAIPTVVHGLAGAAPGRSTVLVAQGTYPERYASADVVEYAMRRPRGWDRYADAATSRVGLPRGRARATYRAALAVQERLAPSVVLAHNAVQALPEVDSRRHVPVLYAHNDLLRTYGRREIDRTFRGAAGVVAVSENLADHLRRHLPLAMRSRVEVVVNGVDTEIFHPPERWERAHTLRVLFVGRTIPAKGADVLVEAVRRLGRDDVALEIVGRAGFSPADRLTTHEEHLRRAAHDLGDRVAFRSFVERPDVAALLRTADVVVVPSRWPDPCPLTVLEGMASGAALVASAVGGIPEQVGDDGLLVPPDDPAALAAVLEHLATDEGALRTARGRARDRALTRTWKHARTDLDAALARLI